jgi:hypothetical protein
MAEEAVVVADVIIVVDTDLHWGSFAYAAAEGDIPFCSQHTVADLFSVIHQC